MPAKDFGPRPIGDWPHKLPTGPEPCWDLSTVPETQKQRIQVAKPPPQTDAFAVREHRLNIALHSHPIEQVGEVDSGVHRKLQRSPETSVTLEQLVGPIPGIAVAL